MADILIELASSEISILDRAQHYAPHFRRIGLPAELFVYTSEELADDPPPVAVTALKTGMDLLM